MKRFEDLQEEVLKAKKDPRYLKHAARELGKLRKGREQEKEQNKQNQAAKSVARSRLRDRELKRERERKEDNSPIQKVSVKVHEPESKPKDNPESKAKPPKDWVDRTLNKKDKARQNAGREAAQVHVDKKNARKANPKRNKVNPAGNRAQRRAAGGRNPINVGKKPMAPRAERREAGRVTDKKKRADDAEAESRAKKASQDENNRSGKKWWKVWEEMQNLDERANSPAGRERLEKQAAQNQQNRQVKTGKIAANQQERSRAVAAAKAVESKVRRDAGQDNQKVKPARGNPRTRPVNSTPAPKAEPKASTKVADAVRNKKQDGGPETITSKNRHDNNYNTHAFDGPKTKGGSRKNNPAKTPDDNVAGAADRLKKKGDDDKSYKNVMKKIRQRKNNEKIAKIKAQRSDGFGAGLKSSLGGDVWNRKTDAESIKKKKDARNKAGQSVGNFMKKAPGRLARTILSDKSSTKADTSDSQDLSGPKKGVYNG